MSATKRIRISCWDTKYTIYLSLYTLSADPNPFRGTHCHKWQNSRCIFSVLLRLASASGSYCYLNAKERWKFSSRIAALFKWNSLVPWLEVGCQCERSERQQQQLDHHPLRMHHNSETFLFDIQLVSWKQFEYWVNWDTLNKDRSTKVNPVL